MLQIAAASRPDAAGGVPLHVTYVPRPGLLRLTLTNFLLNLATLFIYRFWAKTKVRRHVWSCVHINGDPLEYTGTGKELFLGALIVFLLFILPLVLLAVGATLWLGPQHPIASALQFAGTLLVLLFTGLAVYRARRYRLSRTLWRGIRGTLVGSAFAYSLLYFASFLLKGLTLGWSTPALNTELQKRIVSEMRFGNAPFSFRGSAGALYPAYAVSWFGMVVLILIGFAVAAGLYWVFFTGVLRQIFDPQSGTSDGFGVSLLLAVVIGGLLLYVLYLAVWSIYGAKEMRAFAAYTSLHNARLRLDATGPSLFALWFGNLLIFISTIGIGAPFILQRNVRYFCDRLTIDGTVNIASIGQSTEPVLKRGEGLAEAFDIDGF